MLTNRLDSSYSTQTNEFEDSAAKPDDENQSDNPLASAYAREVRLSTPQLLAKQPDRQKTEPPDNQLIHLREPRLFIAIGEYIPVHHSKTPSQDEEASPPAGRNEHIVEFVQKTIFHKPYIASAELAPVIGILKSSRCSSDTIDVLLSSIMTIESFNNRLDKFSQNESLDDQSLQPQFFKLKVSERLDELTKLVDAYNFLMEKANIVIESYNALHLQQNSYDLVAKKCLFLSEQMGKSALTLAAGYINLQLSIEKAINNPKTPIYCLPTLLKSLISCAIMHFQCALESRLRDLDATNNIAAHRPNPKKAPRKFSGINHVLLPTLKKPRLAQPQLNDSLFNLSKSIATVELFARSRGKSQIDLLSQARKRLFELIDHYIQETGVPIAEMFTTSVISTIEKYLCYAELLHASDATPEKQIPTRVAILEKIAHLATLNDTAKSKNQDDKNDIDSLAKSRERSQTYRRHNLSDHILLGIETFCTALNKMVRFEALQNRCHLAMQMDQLQEELHNLDLWTNHLHELGLINDENLTNCPGYQQLISIRELLHELATKYQSGLAVAYEEAAKLINTGQTKEANTQNVTYSPAAELSTPLDPTLFGNKYLLKKINYLLFAENELTVNEWDKNQGEQLIQRFATRKQASYAQPLIVFIECCQHDEQINQFINECRLIFQQIHPYVTSLPATHLQQSTKNAIKHFNEQINRLTTLNRKIQSQLQNCNKKINKLKLKTDEQHPILKQELCAAVQTAIRINAERQLHVNTGFNRILEERKQILVDDFPSLYFLEKQVYGAPAKNRQHMILSKKIAKSSDAPSRPFDSAPQNLPDNSRSFITTPLYEMGFTLENSPSLLDNLKIPCFEHARENRLTGKQLLDYISHQLRIPLAVYITASDDFYSPPSIEPAATEKHNTQISFSNFLTTIRIKLDDQSIIKKRNYFHQCIANRVNTLIERKIPVVYMGSRAFRTQLQSLWGSQALECIDHLTLPRMDPAITKRATTPRDTDLLIRDKAQFTSVKQQVHETLLNAAQQNSDLKTDFEITTTDERTEIFYGSQCLSCTLILHKKGHRQPNHWIYVVDLVTCLNTGVSPLDAYDSPHLPSGKTVHSRRIDAIIMDELNLAISMAAGPTRALMAITRISIVAALEVSSPKLDNMVRIGLIHALDTIRQRYPDPAFDQLAASLRSQTFTVIDHQEQLWGVKPPAKV